MFTRTVDCSLFLFLCVRVCVCVIEFKHREVGRCGGESGRPVGGSLRSLGGRGHAPPQGLEDAKLSRINNSVL